MKVRNNQPLTIDDVFAYRQARFKLEPDHEQNRVLLEAYLQAKANGEPLESVDERKVLEEWRKVEEEWTRIGWAGQKEAQSEPV